MSRSPSLWILVVMTTAAGLFEAATTFVIEQPWASALFAAVFLGCAAALWFRGSRVAAVVTGLFLLADVGGVPFYDKQGLGDWVIQLAFAALGVVGLVACVNVLRAPRPSA